MSAAESPRDNNPVCHECGAHVPQIEQLQQLYLTKSRELVAVRNRLDRLQSGQDGRDSELYEQALEVANYWKQLLAPRTRELKGPRVDNTYARLKGDGTGKPYSVDDLKQAVYGYYCCQYVVDAKRVSSGKPSERHVDLELLMRDPKHVDKGIALARENAGYDVELMHKGTSALQARLCDCGHPEVDHLRPDLALELGLIDAQAPGQASIPREPCAHKDCACYTFDTIHQHIEAYREEQAHAPKPPPPRNEVPGQLRLVG